MLEKIPIFPKKREVEGKAKMTEFMVKAEYIEES